MKNKKNILWIDDDISIIGTLTRILEKLGYSVITKEKISEVLNDTGKKKLQTCDVILIDLIIPQGGYDDYDFGILPGLKLAKHIKKELNILQPIIALSGVARPEIREEFEDIDWSPKALKENYGIQALLAKPIRASDLDKKIQELL